MKKSIITLLILLSVFTIATAFVFKSKQSSGIAGYTGSPSEGNCGSCHGGGSAIASGITITAIPAFSSNSYISGTIYTITIDVAATGFSKYGFGCEILNSSNTNAGILQNAGAGVKFLNAGNGRKNAVHTTPKNGTNGTTFTFEWTAPASGSVTFYVGANAVNGNGGTGGDFTFNKSMALTESTGVGMIENTSQSISSISVFPNPSNGLTQIAYFLSKQQSINIQITDLSGKLIKEVINETQYPGSHSHLINTAGIPAGAYFIKTCGSDQKISQKLICIY